MKNLFTQQLHFIWFRVQWQNLWSIIMVKLPPTLIGTCKEKEVWICHDINLQLCSVCEKFLSVMHTYWHVRETDWKRVISFWLLLRWGKEKKFARIHAVCGGPQETWNDGQEKATNNSHPQICRKHICFFLKFWLHWKVRQCPTAPFPFIWEPATTNHQKATSYTCISQHYDSLRVTNCPFTAWNLF